VALLALRAPLTLGPLTLGPLTLGPLTLGPLALAAVVSCAVVGDAEGPLVPQPANERATIDTMPIEPHLRCRPCDIRSPPEQR